MSQIADAPHKNWVDTYSPLYFRPYLRLARADRPIGIWLLLWPCWWALTLAGGTGSLLLTLWYFLLFAIGATVMRAAGCIYNDILDRDIDAQVERTKNRPLASGEISVKKALLFMLLCCLAGLFVLLQFNWFTVFLGISSLGIVAIYPIMKRVTYWPQLVLGLAFSWGALVGWSCIHNSLDWPAYCLYTATILWTIGYDTIYAHQDKEDDALLGLKSTALRFGNSTKLWLFIFYGITIVLLSLAGFLADIHYSYFAGIFLGTLHLLWQITTLDIRNNDNCLARFRSNRDFGAIIFASLVTAEFIIPNL